MLLGQEQNPVQFRLSSARVLEPWQCSWQHHSSAAAWLSVCANKDLVPWLQWMINSVSLVAMWAMCLCRLVLPALGAQYSFPLPLLTLPEMWLLCYFQEGFCWRPCWRVRFASMCMGVTKSLRSFAFGDMNLIKWRAEGEHDPLFQQCALPWQVSQVAHNPSCLWLWVAPVLPLTDKASLKQAYCRQNFGEHMMKREYNNNNHNMNAIFESHRKGHAGLEWSQSSNIIHISEVFCFQWLSNYWI